MDFASMKRNRKESLNKLVEETEKQSKQQYEQDKRFWSPTVDDDGKGFAVIRFMPPPPGEEMPYVNYYQHNFKGPGGHWYNERSLTSLNQKDPVGEFNRKLWNNGTQAGKDQASAQKRQQKFVANILVIKDSANPEAEGGVYLYKYGPMINGKIEAAIKPEFDDEPFNPFDMWEGANFKIKIKPKDKWRDYSESGFDRVTELCDGDDEKLEHIWKQCHSLQEFVDPKLFKSYEELEQRLNFVMEDVVSDDSSDTATDTEDAPQPSQNSTQAVPEDDVDPLPERSTEVETLPEGENLPTPQSNEPDSEETEAKKNYDKFRNLAK